MTFKYETHMHTEEGSGCGRDSGADQAYVYKERGYSGIIITDHFINGYSTCPKHGKLSWEEKMRYVIAGYESAKIEGDRLGLDVFFGWEFTILGSDFLTYGLDWDFLMEHPNLDKYDIKKYSKAVRAAGGYLAQAHPYRKADYIQHQLPVDPKYVDGIEVYNASDRPGSNAQALKFAQENDLPFQSGSDSHGVNNRITSGIVLKHKAESIFDIIKAIKGKEVELIRP